MTPRFLTLFAGVILRESWRHPVLALLNVAGIALGVAVFLSVQMANRAAVDSFRAAASLTTGRADVEVRGDIPEDVLPAVAATPGVQVATPIVEGLVGLPDHPGEYLRLLGIDPFTGRDLFVFTLNDVAAEGFDIERWLSDPDVLAVQPAIRERFGDRLVVLAGAGRRELEANFLLRPDHPLASPDPRVAAMDIGWAQELFGLTGRLSSIQIVVSDPSRIAKVTARLREVVPSDVSVEGPDARRREMETMLGAFHLNLTAMSLVSIVVGMFLITNTVSAAVVRRRSQVATLRACGASRLEVRALFLGEAAVAGLIGVALGIPLAPILVQAASPALSLSISSLYDVVRLDRIPVEPAEAWAALVIGLAASLGAAWRPASEAARSQPALILRPGAMEEERPSLRVGNLVGAAVFLAVAGGCSWWALQGGPRISSLAAAGAVLAGFSLMVPWLAAAMALVFRRGGRLTRLSADHLVRAMPRNALTMAALSAAVAMAVSVAVMIHSFRASVGRWIHQTLIADLYVAPAINEIAGARAFLPADTLAWATARPEIADLATYRELTVRVRGGEPVTMAVLAGGARGKLDFLPGSPPDAGERFSSGDAAAVSESLARRLGLVPGDRVMVATPAGPREIVVAGIARDFTSERGVLFVRNQWFARHWADPRIHSIGFQLRDPSAASELAEAFRTRFGDQGEFAIYDHAALRERVFRIFDQTFAVTNVLRGVAVLVAVAGVMLSFSILVIEREREVGVLRAVGASRAQVFFILLGEAVLLGLAATLSGIASGSALAMVLTWVVNKAYFGWSIALSYPIATLAATPLWLIPAVALASLIPGWRAAHLPPARAVHFE